MAAVRLALVALALAAVLLAPAALAQGVPGAPDPQKPCGTALLTPASSALAFAPGETQQVVVSAAIGGSGSVNADAVVRLSAPAGWTVTPESVQVQNIAANDRKDAEFTVTAPNPLAQGGRAETLSATGSFTCFATVGTQRQSLGTMPAPEAASITASARAPGGAAAYLTDETLLAAGALTLVLVGAIVVFAVSRKRGTAPGLRLTCAEADKRIRPGRGVSYPLRVENATDKPDAARLEVVEVPEGWTAFMATQEVQLAPRETRIVWLMVRAPGDGTAHGRVDIAVRAHSQVNARDQPTVRVAAAITNDPLVQRVDESVAP